jgi:hypothetical protein
MTTALVRRTGLNLPLELSQGERDSHGGSAAPQLQAWTRTVAATNVSMVFGSAVVVVCGLIAAPRGAAVYRFLEA